MGSDALNEEEEYQGDSYEFISLTALSRMLADAYEDGRDDDWFSPEDYGKTKAEKYFKGNE